MNIHNAFLEVIETLRWGFTDLGYDCSVSLNEVDRRCQNIAFGWVSAFNAGNMHIYPPGTILYNFEQWSNRNLADDPVIREIARNFQIWDYSAANLPRWLDCNPKHRPFHAPVSFAPNLTRIAPAAQPDIDLLYIGSAGPARSAKLTAICTAPNRPALVHLQNVWGAARDSFIGRSQVLLNLSNDDPALRIFELVRVSYYLANRKPVLCEEVPGQHVDADLREHLLFAPREQLPEACAQLLQDPDHRARVAERSQAVARA
jgi:hypothetical protein